MDQIRRKFRDGLTQHGVVPRLQFTQIPKSGDRRQSESAIETQPPLDNSVELVGGGSHVTGSVAAVRGQPEGGRQHADRVPALAERVGHILAAEVVGVRQMRWKEIGDDEDFHCRAN